MDDFLWAETVLATIVMGLAESLAQYLFHRMSTAGEEEPVDRVIDALDRVASTLGDVANQVRRTANAVNAAGQSSEGHDG